MGGDDKEVHEIASSGEVKKLESLLEKHPELLDAKGWFERTPLHCAAQHAHVDCVRLLIERGADVNARSQLSAATALFNAVDSQRHEASPGDALSCAQLLLENGADPNVRSTNRAETAVFHVQSLEMLLLLAKYGADLNVISDEDQYPFEYHAYYVGDPALLKFWLERDVNVNHVPGFGEPALPGVVSNLGTDEHDEERLGQIKQLLDYGADPNIAESLFGHSPLHIAVSNGRMDIARQLLDGGADPNFQNRAKETPLHVAVKNGSVELAQLLIEHGADVNIRDISKHSPWELAKDSAELRPILEPLGRDIPDIPLTPDELIERLVALPDFSRYDFEPCSEGEIAILEQRFNVVLPESYKKFLRLMGKGAGSFLISDHWEAFYHELFEIARRDDYARRCADLPDDYFVFASRLGGIYFFFIADGTNTDDPPVYSFGDGREGTFRKSYDSFWGFIEEMVDYYEYYS
jgi:ankyrin repeat protein